LANLPGSGSGWAGALPEQFGRYRIVRQLGQGGMGAVFLAHDTQLDRPVALKVPHFAPEDGPAARERFYREARAAAVLIHPNLCPVYDVGEHAGTTYLTMGYIEGRPLSELLKAGKPVSPRQAAQAVRRLALGLEEAHRHGIIHRDLKPSNIMINRRGEPVVMDFSLARRAATEDARLTQAGLALGTPSYMPPEQANGDIQAMGPRCDIYSLGVILYELLAGRLPFTGAVLTVLTKIVSEDPLPPSAHRPGLDPRLEMICLKAMAKRPEDRYASMRELAADLGEYLRGESQAAEALPQAEPDPAPLEVGIRESQMGGLRSVAQMRLQMEAPRPARDEPLQPRRGRRSQRRGGLVWLWAGAAAALLVLVGVPLFLLMRPEPQPEPRAETPVNPHFPDDSVVSAWRLRRFP
jgi:serine/threonine protein kinase